MAGVIDFTVYPLLAMGGTQSSITSSPIAFIPLHSGFATHHIHAPGAALGRRCC